MALTFDDGPAQYTEELLTTLKNAGHKATFFLNGNNYGYIYDYNSTVKRMINEGHQVGSHTWTHANIAQISDTQLRSEMSQLDVALQNILGYAPKYFRPVSLDTSEPCNKWPSKGFTETFLEVRPISTH